jgi:hypothetical protein
LLKLQGKSGKTIDAYSRSVRRVQKHFDCCPDLLTVDQLENYFAELIETHSWSTVKLDRLGLMFFWKHTLKLDWQWLNMVKAPKVKTIPDILTSGEIEQLILAQSAGARGLTKSAPRFSATQSPRTPCSPERAAFGSEFGGTKGYANLFK